MHCPSRSLEDYRKSAAQRHPTCTVPPRARKRTRGKPSVTGFQPMERSHEGISSPSDVGYRNQGRGQISGKYRQSLRPAHIGGHQQREADVPRGTSDRQRGPMIRTAHDMADQQRRERQAAGISTASATLSSRPASSTRSRQAAFCGISGGTAACSGRGVGAAIICSRSRVAMPPLRRKAL